MRHSFTCVARPGGDEEKSPRFPVISGQRDDALWRWGHETKVKAMDQKGQQKANEARVAWRVARGGGTDLYVLYNRMDGLGR